MKRAEHTNDSNIDVNMKIGFQLMFIGIWEGNTSELEANITGHKNESTPTLCK